MASPSSAGDCPRRTAANFRPVLRRPILGLRLLVLTSVVACSSTSNRTTGGGAAPDTTAVTAPSGPCADVAAKANGLLDQATSDPSKVDKATVQRLVGDAHQVAVDNPSCF